MKINSLEEKILNTLDKGDNLTTASEIASKVAVSRQTIVKYLHVLQVKGFLVKRKIPVSGGTVNDPRWMSIITKF